MNILRNIILFQAGWLICVLAAANQLPWLGTAIALAIVTWHVLRASNAASEITLLLLAGLTGAVWDSLLVTSGLPVYPSGTLLPGTAPHWIIAMWLLFATTLNVSLRWLKNRLLLAAVLGAVSGPASYYAGHKLGGVVFTDTGIAMLTLAIGWALLMPLLMLLSNRYDGFASVHAQPGTAARGARV